VGPVASKGQSLTGGAREIKNFRFLYSISINIEIEFVPRKIARDFWKI
jgi:hypothetical protein